MLADFLSFLSKHRLLKDPTAPTLIAVSGGIDSVVLCRLFHQAALPFAVAHANFQLRGQEADRDAEWVQHLAQTYRVPCYTSCFETKAFAARRKISIQMAARSLRYAFFEELLQLHGLHQVATAHHWDDSVETTLLHWIKGTGIWGLKGIPLVQGNVVRPLLFARKETIASYACQEGLRWREDSSNRSIDYQRNFVRHRVIPLLHRLNPNLEETMRSTCAKLSDAAGVFARQIRELRSKIVSFEGGVGRIAVDEIAHLPEKATLVFELLRPYGFAFAPIQRALEQPLPSGKTLHAPAYVLTVDRKAWLFERKKSGPLDEPRTLCLDLSELLSGDPPVRTVATPIHQLHLKRLPAEGYVPNKSANFAALDCRALRLPVELRPWRQGDRFCPLGMKGAQKISDFLINAKVPRARKARVWVLTSNGQVAWVVGYRVDERFKITADTQQIWELQVVQRGEAGEVQQASGSMEDLPSG